MVDRLQTFWIDYKRFGSVTQRQGGRTKDTLKAGPAPTTPTHRSPQSVYCITIRCTSKTCSITGIYAFHYNEELTPKRRNEQQF